MVIGFIAIALLMFLLMDALSSNSMINSAGGEKYAGKINGKKIPIQDYANRYNAYENDLRSLYPGQTFDDQTSESIRDQVWNDLILDKLIGKNFNKMGISVSAIEMGFYLWGPNPHTLVRQLFTNPNTGEFNPEQVRYVIQNMEEIDQTGMLAPQMTALQNIIEQERVKTKYFSMIAKGVHIPKFLLQKQNAENMSTALVSIVPFLYSDIDDDVIKVTDEELKNYLNKHSHNYKTEEYVELEYMLVDIIPTSEDSASLMERMRTIFDDFQNTENDSLFAKRNTEVPNTFDYYFRDDLSERVMVDSFFSMPIGKILRPYEEDGAYKVTKILDRKSIADSVNASHVLFKFENAEQRDSVTALADSLITLLKQNRISFADVARIHSKDQSNANIGGALGFFKQGQMVKPFNDKVFYGMKQGDISSVETNFGLHIIRVERSVPSKTAVRLGDCVYAIRAGKVTNSDAFRKAVSMEQAYNTGDKFEKAKDSVAVKRTTPIFSNQSSITGIGTSREVVRWAFKAEMDEVKMFDLENKFIVTRLVKRVPKGIKSLEDVKAEVELEVRNEKKAEKLLEEVKTKMSGSTSIQQVASSTGKEVVTTNVSASSPFIEGVGSEPVVAGAAFSLTPGKLYGPIKGDYGVYVIQIEELSKPEGEPNLQLALLQLQSNIMSKLNYQSILKALKDKAKIEDKRYEFY